jgi:putative transposase
MARFRRLVVPGLPHHVTQRGVRRQTTFFDDLDYRRYLEIAKDLLPNSGLQIWAYCLMPNHIHAVVVPQQPDALAGYFGKLHKKYAQITNFRYEWSGHLWQNRFYSVVMDEQHTLTALRYVERNPVRSGITKYPQDWPWSSARGNLQRQSDPLIPGRPALSVVPNWSDYVSVPETDDDLKSLRKVTGTGRPCGDDGFIEKLERATGRKVRKRKAGRIKK